MLVKVFPPFFEDLALKRCISVTEPFHHCPTLIVDEGHIPSGYSMVLGVDAQRDRLRCMMPLLKNRHGAGERTHAKHCLSRMNSTTSQGVGALVMRSNHDRQVFRQVQLCCDMVGDLPDQCSRRRGCRQYLPFYS